MKPVTGDINGDGTVTVLDVVALQKYLLKTNTFTKAQYTSADMNGDGIVNIYDLILMKKAVLAK